MAICHSFGIGETKTYSPGFGLGEFQGVFCFRYEAFRGNSGISVGDGVGDGVLNSNHRGTGQGKMSWDLREQVSRVPHGIPTFERQSARKMVNRNLDF